MVRTPGPPSARLVKGIPPPEDFVYGWHSTTMAAHDLGPGRATRPKAQARYLVRTMKPIQGWIEP